MIRVLICDDQDVVRRGLQVILGHSEGIEVVAVAADGQAGVAAARQHRPDVVLMDLNMPKLNGIQATRQISADLPDTRVLVLTTFDADDWVFDAIRAGASGYLLKDADGADIAAAVHDTAAGRVWLDPAIAGKVLAAFNEQSRRAAAAPAPEPLPEALSEREMSILRLMAQGKNNRQIAAELHLAAGTIKNNVSEILGKLHSNDRTQAVLAALRRGLVSLEETTPAAEEETDGLGT